MDAKAWEEPIEKEFGLVPVIMVMDREGDRHRLRGAYVTEPGVGKGNAGRIHDVTSPVRAKLEEAGLGARLA